MFVCTSEQKTETERKRCRQRKSGKKMESKKDKKMLNPNISEIKVVRGCMPTLIDVKLRQY